MTPEARPLWEVHALFEGFRIFLLFLFFPHYPRF
jgi:hypothetical protein